MADSIKVTNLTPSEESLLLLHRNHPNEDISILHDPFDATHEKLYIALDKQEERYREVEDKGILTWKEAKRVLASFIAAHDGVPVADVSLEYSKRTLRESQERLEREIKNKKYAAPNEIAEKLIRAAAIDLT